MESDSGRPAARGESPGQGPGRCRLRLAFLAGKMGLLEGNPPKSWRKDRQRERGIFPGGKLRHGEGEGLAQRPPPPPLQLSSARTRGPAGGGAQAQQVPSTAGAGRGCLRLPSSTSRIFQMGKRGPRAEQAKPPRAAGASARPPLSRSGCVALLEPVGLGPPSRSTFVPPRPASRPQPGSATRPVPRGPLGSTAGNCPVFCQPQGNSRLGSGMSC